jgi:hypothetical protein
MDDLLESPPKLLSLCNTKLKRSRKILRDFAVAEAMKRRSVSPVSLPNSVRRIPTPVREQKRPKMSTEPRWIDPPSLKLAFEELMRIDDRRPSRRRSII